MAGGMQGDARRGCRVSTLEEAFTRLLGKQPTDREKQDLYRTRDALNLKNNDAMWLLLMALGHYETVYGRFPALISKAATDVLEKAKAAADSEFKAAAARAEGDLAQTVAKTALDIAGRAASTKRWQWISGCVAGSAVMFLLVGWWSYRTGMMTGDASGQVRGYAAARREEAAASWANTPDGQLAYRLAQVGSIRELATCSGRGWFLKDGICFSQAEKGKTHGWRISAGSGR